MEKWKIALKEFLKKYEDDDNVIGAILAGSYTSDNFDDNSDIDVILLLKDSTNFEERGITESNSYLIEYFMYTPSITKAYFKKQFKNKKMPLIYMYGYGKIIYDLEGEAKKLQDLALEYIDSEIGSITSNDLDMNNYHIWDYLDELSSSLKEESERFNLIYYKLLSEMYNIYSEYLGIPKLPETKIYKILTDTEYREKYHIYKLPEEEFIKLYLKCYELDKPNIMYKNISNLVEYYYKKQGGFNIRTFNIRKEYD